MPGSTLTAGYSELTPTEEQHQAFVATSEAATPLGRLANPDEIAATLFLASEESSYVNGSEMFDDGGSAQI